MPAGDSRLAEFLDWMAESGLEPSSVADFRRVAVELFQASGGARVTESHILKLIDAYAEREGAQLAVAAIEEVGESLLRYQSARKLQSGPLPVRRRTPSEPFTARPDERIAGELRQPDSSRDTGPEPRVVSFTGPQPVQREPAPEPPAPPTPGPARPPAPRRRGSQFRCLKCKVMVTATEIGTCPHCNMPAVRVSSNQLPVVKRSLSRSSTTWIIPVLLGVFAFMLAFELGPGLLDKLRHPSEPAAGTTSSPHLGMQLTLPEHWRHAADGDRAPTTRGVGLEQVLPDLIALRTSRYFRGASGEPEAQLYLTVAPRPTQITDDAVRAWAARPARAKIQGSVRELSGVADLMLERCSTGETVPGHALRCAGNAGHDTAIVYIWAARNAIAVAVYLSANQSLNETQVEADEVIAGLDPR